MQPEQQSAKKMPSLSELPQKIGALAHMAATNTAMWMVQNRKSYPAFFFWGGAVAFGIVIACITLSQISTTATQMAVRAVMQAGIGICSVAFLVVIFTMTVGTYRAVEYRAMTAPPDASVALPETVDTWQPPSIAPDILVCLLPGESLTAFAQRVKDIQNGHAITHAIWALIVPPFNEHVMILTAETETDFVFTRGNEPFFDEPQAWAGKPDHKNETIRDYRRYVEWVAAHFAKWASAQKLSVRPDRSTKTFVEEIAAQAACVNQ